MSSPKKLKVAVYIILFFTGIIEFHLEEVFTLTHTSKLISTAMIFFIPSSLWYCADALERNIEIKRLQRYLFVIFGVLFLFFYFIKTRGWLGIPKFIAFYVLVTIPYTCGYLITELAYHGT